MSRKITKYVAWLKRKGYIVGSNERLLLGNLNAKRDWGYAPDYVEAYWRMLQQDKPDDYVLATGITNTVEAFVQCAFKHIGIANWKNYVEISDKFKRPAEVDVLKGDSSKAYRVLGWQAETPFDYMVQRMVDAE